MNSSRRTTRERWNACSRNSPAARSSSGARKISPARFGHERRRYAATDPGQRADTVAGRGPATSVPHTLPARADFTRLAAVGRAEVGGREAGVDAALLRAVRND